MMLSYQSSKALKAMEVTLNRAVHDATGQTVRVYLNSLMECLQAVYESEQGHAGAEKYVAFLKEMRPVSFSVSLISEETSSLFVICLGCGPVV